MFWTTEKRVLVKALEEAQEKNANLIQSLQKMYQDTTRFRAMASPFLDYQGVQIAGAIPIRLTFLDFEDDIIVTGTLDALSHYEDLIVVNNYWSNIHFTATTNQYVIIQPDIPLSPPGAASVCTELVQRIAKITQDASIGAQVNEALGEVDEETTAAPMTPEQAAQFSGVPQEEYEDEDEDDLDFSTGENIVFRVAQPDRHFVAYGNVLKVWSDYLDLGKHATTKDKLKIREAFPEYEVVFDPWDGR